MSMVALPRRGSRSSFFITVAAWQRQMFSPDGHLCYDYILEVLMSFFKNLALFFL
jgi:hypothetical protein